MPFPVSEDDDATTVEVIITDAATRTLDEVVKVPANTVYGSKFSLNGKWYYHVDEAADGSWRFVTY